MPINYPVTDCLQTHLINEQLTQLFAHKYVCGLPVPRLLPVRLLSVLCKSAESNGDRPAWMDCLFKKVIIFTAHSQLTKSSICSRRGFSWLYVRSFIMCLTGGVLLLNLCNFPCGIVSFQFRTLHLNYQQGGHCVC